VIPYGKRHPVVLRWISINYYEARTQSTQTDRKTDKKLTPGFLTALLNYMYRTNWVACVRFSFFLLIGHIDLLLLLYSITQRKMCSISTKCRLLRNYYHEDNASK